MHVNVWGQSEASIDIEADLKWRQEDGKGVHEGGEEGSGDRVKSKYGKVAGEFSFDKSKIEGKQIIWIMGKLSNHLL